MLRNFVNIEGISDSSNYPILGINDRYTQFTVEETLTIPTVKPDVEQITEIMIEATIIDYRTIATPTGVKVIIDGELNQKVIYVAEEPTQSVHSAEFIAPFCTTINVPLVIPAGTNVLQQLQLLGLTLDTVVVVPPKVIIEDLSVTLVDPRTLTKCAILFTWVGLNPVLAPLFPPIL